MERPDQHGVDGGPPPEVDAGGSADGLGGYEEVSDPKELRTRLIAKDDHIRELYGEVSRARLAVDEAGAAREAEERRVGGLEEERALLRERVRDLEREERRRRRRRDGHERRIERLEREVERRGGEIARRDHLLRHKEEELEKLGSETGSAMSRKDEALEDALRRVDGLQRDLEEREAVISELRSTVAALRRELEGEHESRRRLAEPANRLRAGIDLFNGSEPSRAVVSISKSLGRPEVRVVLGEGEEPPVMLTFAWQDITWRTYAANPGPDVAEPRVYLRSAGDDTSEIGPGPPNARVGPGGRVLLGL